MREDGLFKKVGAVILLVSDMERSVKFYRDVLNLPIKSQSDDWTEFFGSGTVIALHPAKRKAKISTGIGVLVGFMVNNFDFTINKLKAKERKVSLKNLNRNLLACILSLETLMVI